MLVTDAISALGLEEGIHQLGQLKIEIRKGSAYIAGTDTLCGSTAEMSKCVRHFKEATGKLSRYSFGSTNIHVYYIYLKYIIFLICSISFPPFFHAQFSIFLVVLVA